MIVSRPEFQTEHRPQRGKCKQAPRSRLPNVTLHMHDPGGAMLSVAGTEESPWNLCQLSCLIYEFHKIANIGTSFPARPYPGVNK
ncbi:uncharacterized protein Bfra_010640 [Botrytis fragariae]|uniref:Uncharacterized protein n=1 Tax=Botrytis fragariae TaxID=1964551 RepID=A0A8H6AH23_9HELO|nr:uncharacterized protein Bfra_010640 [Botrytis fragariae]KAF5867671.1 hypothetical protein Bfra_010640 [Botrytis fragariae]